jgi:hypothetical protein
MDCHIRFFDFGTHFGYIGIAEGCKNWKMRSEMKMIVIAHTIF